VTDRLREVTTPDEWERVLSAATFVQRIVPDAILVGGSAAAIYAKHRYSADDDHVVPDLRARFERVLGDIERAAGWSTVRIRPPVLILGNFEGVDTGIRNLLRSAPLETTAIHVPQGTITIPTLPEMLRVKAWLTVSRNAMRDYIDTAALADKLGESASVEALRPLDDLYPQPHVEASQQLMKQLADPRPSDPDTDLAIYKALRTPYTDYAYVRDRCKALAVALLRDRSASDA
jgi:hypothetical protein